MSNKQIIEVVQAAEEGKTIQVRSGMYPNEWENCSNLCECPWNFGMFDYRVAPEPRKPRELTLLYKGSGVWQEWMSVTGPCLKDCIHVREVIYD